MDSKNIKLTILESEDEGDSECAPERVGCRLSLSLSSAAWINLILLIISLLCLIRNEIYMSMRNPCEAPFVDWVKLICSTKFLQFLFLRFEVWFRSSEEINNVKITAILLQKVLRLRQCQYDIVLEQVSPVPSAIEFKMSYLYLYSEWNSWIKFRISTAFRIFFLVYYLSSNSSSSSFPHSVSIFHFRIELRNLSISSFMSRSLASRYDPSRNSPSKVHKPSANSSGATFRIPFFSCYLSSVRSSNGLGEKKRQRSRKGRGKSESEGDRIRGYNPIWWEGLLSISSWSKRAGNWDEGEARLSVCIYFGAHSDEEIKQNRTKTNLAILTTRVFFPEKQSATLVQTSWFCFEIGNIKPFHE